ncbi:MAG: cobalamin-binding protein [Candidatus Dadabacteria bacterium]|nr:MAG: cobalamin-binding protein [Candidatus Dadabacteria bacterium]
MSGGAKLCRSGARAAQPADRCAGAGRGHQPLNFMRIVSLLPSATDIVAALGAADQLVGVSHECDHPAARGRPILTRASVDPNADHAAIDAAVRDTLAEGRSLYQLDGTQLASLQPDLVITQALCDVCAVNYSTVERVVASLDPAPDLIDLNPGGLQDILDDVRRVGRALGLEGAAASIIEQCRERLRNLRLPVRTMRVLALEWLDPWFVGGHWVPEQIALAGGTPVAGFPRCPSYTISPGQIATAERVDLVVVMPCGYDLDAAAALTEAYLDALRSVPALQHAPIAAVDANRFFSRPSPAVFDGIEVLAALFARDDPRGRWVEFNP